MDLRKKAEYYKIDPAWAAFDPVPVLKTPTYGDMTAPELVKKLKINSQKDKVQLAEAKEIAYKEGFYSGIMVIGEFKGESDDQREALHHDHPRDPTRHLQLMRKRVPRLSRPQNRHLARRPRACPR